jgi:biopolymer transport protein TolQ
LDQVAVNAGSITFSPLALFLHADIVVKIVMIGLLLASIASWAITIGHWLKMRRVSRDSERFERAFWKAEDTDAFYRDHKDNELPSAKVFSAGMFEWRRSTQRGTIDREGTRARLATSMGAAIASELDRLGDRLNILATVGSVAPFVGLFGTVWGIMATISAMGQNANMAIIAPKISEALFATAVGLFAAIPAVIAYNRFGHGLNRLEARLSRFADAFHATLSRELEMDR